MLPRTHLIYSVLAVAIMSLLYNLKIHIFILWLFIAGITSLAVDLDYLVYPLLKKKNWSVMKKIIRDPLYIPKNPKAFVDEIHFKGLGIIRLGTHTVWGIVIYFFTRNFYPSFIVPVLVSLATHITLDIYQAITYPERR